MKKSEFSLSAKMRELEEIEQYFQKPDMNLDAAMKKHEEALLIAKDLYAYLDAAETTIKKLEVDMAVMQTGSRDQELQEPEA